VAANTSRDMQAVLFELGGRVAVQAVPAPARQPDGVLLRVRACGICGSDLHTLRSDREPPPIWLGHEIAGEVLEADRSSGLQPGDHVAVEPFVTCGECGHCQAGSYNHCTAQRFVGYSLPGGYAEFLQIPSGGHLHRLPADLAWDKAAMTEPLAVGVHALRLAGLSAGLSVAFVGGGTIGLLALQAARAMGASRTAMLAKYEHQGSLARRLGADAVALTSEVDPIARLTHELGGPADVVVEAVGARSDAPNQALSLVRPLGTVVLTGVFTGPVEVTLSRIVGKEVRLLGSNCYNAAMDQQLDFDIAIDMLASGAVDVGAVITHRFPLSQAPEAFAVSLDKGTGVVKAVLLP